MNVKPCAVFLGLAVPLFLAVPLSLGAQSSPFYDLRNQPEPSGAEDTVTVEVEEDGPPEREETDTSVQGDVGPDTDVTPDTVTSNQSPESSPPTEDPEADDGQEETATGEPTETTSDQSEEESAEEETEVTRDSSDTDQGTRDSPDSDQDPTPDEGPVLPLMEPGIPFDSGWQVKSSTVPGTGPTGTGQLTLADSPSLVVAGYDDETGSWFQRPTFLLGGSVLFGLLGLVFLYFWLRRPRVRVLETANHTANKYLRRHRAQSNSNVGDSVRTSPDKQGNAVSSEPNVSRGRQDQQSEDSARIQFSIEDLIERGINPRYRPVLELYFEDGLSEEEIAEQEEVGVGEVGLTVDLARRLGESSSSGNSGV